MRRGARARPGAARRRTRAQPARPHSSLLMVVGMMHRTCRNTGSISCRSSSFIAAALSFLACACLLGCGAQTVSGDEDVNNRLVQSGGVHDAVGDVVVYGSTPGAVISAVAAARQGVRTILVDPAPRVGGMCSGGLGHTDRGNSIVIGGLAQEFFARNRAHYHPGMPIHDTPGTICHNIGHDTDIGCGFYLEPHVAERIFLEMMQQAGVQHIRTNGSYQVESVAKEGTVIKSFTLEDGSVVRGKVFIDGT